MNKQIAWFLTISMMSVQLAVFFDAISPCPVYANDAGSSAEPVSVKNEIFKLKDSYHKTFVSLIAAKKYDELEKLFQSVDADKAELPNGKPKIDYLYASLVFEEQAYEIRASESDFIAVIAALDSWSRAKPKSAYALVALAFAYNDYGWFARGGGFSHTVSEDGWKQLAQRQQYATTYLDKAKKLQPEQISSFVLRLNMAKDTENSDKLYPQILKEVFEKYPHAKTPYFRAVLNLQPRWGGSAGEWERFAQTSADKLSGVAGDKFYSQLVWAVDKTHWYQKENLFREFRLDYPRIKRGFTALRASYPKSYLLLSEYCHIASLAGDKETAKKLFTELSGKVDYDAWWDEDTFLTWRKYYSR